VPIPRSLPLADDIRPPVASAGSATPLPLGGEAGTKSIPTIGDRKESASTCGILPGDIAAAFRADPLLMPAGKLVGSITLVAPDGRVVARTQPRSTLERSEPVAAPQKHPVPANLDRIPVTSIQVDVRPVSAATDPFSIATGTSDHAFITVTRANGFKQVLAADPVPADALSGKSQLTFEPGTEKKAEVAHPQHPTDLHPPEYPGLSDNEALTRYGNELVQGAKDYETHPVRYDALGSQGWNSNGWVGSLIAAKGGDAGRADVAALAKEYDGGQPLLQPSTTGTPPWKPDADQREADLIGAASGNGRIIVPGMHNPTIPADRFEAGTPHDVVAKYPPSGDVTRKIFREIRNHPETLQKNADAYLNQRVKAEREELEHLFTLPTRSRQQ